MPKVELDNQYEAPWSDYQMYNRTTEQGKKYITGYRKKDGKQLRKYEYQKALWEDDDIPNSIADINKITTYSENPKLWMKLYMRGSRGNKNTTRKGYNTKGSRSNPQQRYPDSKFQGYGGKVKKSDLKKIEEHKKSEKVAMKKQKEKHEEQGKVNKIIDEITDAPKPKKVVISEDEEDPEILLTAKKGKGLTDKQKKILKSYRAKIGADTKAEKKAKLQAIKDAPKIANEKRIDDRNKKVLDAYNKNFYNPLKKMFLENEDLIKDYLEENTEDGDEKFKQIEFTVLEHLDAKPKDLRGFGYKYNGEDVGQGFSQTAFGTNNSGNSENRSMRDATKRIKAIIDRAENPDKYSDKAKEKSKIVINKFVKSIIKDKRIKMAANKKQKQMKIDKEKADKLAKEVIKEKAAKEAKEISDKEAKVISDKKEQKEFEDEKFQKASDKAKAKADAKLDKFIKSEKGIEQISAAIDDAAMSEKKFYKKTGKKGSKFDIAAYDEYRTFSSGAQETLDKLLSTGYERKGQRTSIGYEFSKKGLMKLKDQINPKGGAQIKSIENQIKNADKKIARYTKSGNMKKKKQYEKVKIELGNELKTLKK